MILVMTEAQLRAADGDLFWRVRNGGTIEQNRFELEYGYYVVETSTAAGKARIEIIAPGPYVDRYSAEHVAITQHGMEPADGDASDEQDHLPW